MSLKNNFLKVKHSLPPTVRLVVVSKTQPVSSLQEIYDTGHRIFGENKVQELLQKQVQLPSDIEWHFIGHLQTNKIKQIVPFIGLIHSVDSLKLLAEINKEAAKLNRQVDCLLQFHIAAEETKFGLDPTEARQLLQSREYMEMKNIRICGIMGMATFTEDESVVKKEFKTLKDIFETLKKEFFTEQPYFREISMGMSGDYEWAVQEGSTLVRIGTAIFGERNYQK